MEYLGLIGGLGGGSLLLWGLKKIPNEKICAFVEGSFEKLGIFSSQFLPKFHFPRRFQWTKKKKNLSYGFRVN